MATATPVLEAKLSRSPGRVGMLGFGVVLLIGIIYSAYHLLTDLAASHNPWRASAFVELAKYYERRERNYPLAL